MSSTDFVTVNLEPTFDGGFKVGDFVYYDSSSTPIGMAWGSSGSSRDEEDAHDLSVQEFWRYMREHNLIDNMLFGDLVDSPTEEPVEPESEHAEVEDAESVYDDEDRWSKLDI